MPPAFAGDTQYLVPRKSSRWSALALAAAVHALLFFFLWAGVRWQNTEPVAVEAEVWDMKTLAAAPPPIPAPEPVAAPSPPMPAPPPKPVEAEPIEAPVAPKPPDIALERRAKLKAEKEQQAEDLQRRELRQREQDRAAAAQAKAKAQEKANAKAEEKAKQLADAKSQKERAESQAREHKELTEAKDRKELADKKQADKQAKTKKALDEQKALDKTHQAEMNRITNASGSGTAGAAAKSTAPRIDSGYVAAIQSKIKSNIAYNGSTDVAGNPRAVFKIEQLPTGEIISVRKIKSSGIAAYDSAVENAIAKSSPLPKKKDGTVVREVEAVFDMKDLP